MDVSLEVFISSRFLRLGRFALASLDSGVFHTEH